MTNIEKKFWSIYVPKNYNAYHGQVWLCIPPHKKYIPDWYPKGALVKKHEEKWLPPPGYWLEEQYEAMVYEGRF